MTDQTSPYFIKCSTCGQNAGKATDKPNTYRCPAWHETTYSLSGAPPEPAVKLSKADFEAKAHNEFMLNGRAFDKAEMLALIALTNKQPSGEHSAISKEELEKLKREIEHVRKGECWAGYAISIRLGGENKLMTNTLPRLIAAVEQQDELVAELAEARRQWRNYEAAGRDVLARAEKAEAKNASLAARVKEMEAFVQKVIDWPDHMNIYDMRKLARHLKQAGDKQ